MGGIHGIVEDRWLAETIGRPVYHVLVPDLESPRRSALTPKQRRRIEELQADRAFLYAKVPTRDLATVGLLESLGFRLVDTNVVFVKPVDAAARVRPQCGKVEGRPRIRLASPEDRHQVVSLARRSFAYSRFHLDPAIPKLLADKIKALWIENYFHGRRGDAMVVAEIGGGIAGFCLLILGQNAATIDLIAVAGSRRGQGLAGQMICFAENHTSEFAEIRVGTQLANLASIRCYERLGFRLEESYYVFHYHNPPKISRREWESSHATRRV